jgi:2-polyprenyl-6-methoxyphenol hydroxylase-like FAD-dependent oxidoreductase
MSARVAIIGAGPAGSAAAILLARGGCNVTLVEQHRFPREKVCGECLSAQAIAAIERLGLSNQLADLGRVVFTHVAIHSPDGRSARLPLPRPMWGLSRLRLDSLLLDTARRAGARIMQPARCEAVESSMNPTARIRMLTSNRVIILQADRVIVADGKGSLIRAKVPTGDLGIKAHFEGIDAPRDTIELFGCHGTYGGLAAIEDRRWNAAFSVPAERLRRHRGNIAGAFGEIVGENRALRRRMAGARQVAGWIASPLPRFAVRDDWPAKVVPAGNAAAALEPIGGEGMGLALCSAERAAASLLNGAGTPLSDQYRRLWRVRRPCCRAAALLVSRPALAGLLTPLLQASPGLGRLGLRLLGK